MTATKEDYKDRRIFPRHIINDSSAVMLSPDYIVSFSILDISRSGMAFSYTAGKLESKPQDNALVDFYCEKSGGAEDIKAQIISDTEMVKKNHALLMNIFDQLPYLRRCGLEFKVLSTEQETAIHEYIQSVKTN